LRRLRRFTWAPLRVAQSIGELRASCRAHALAKTLQNKIRAVRKKSKRIKKEGGGRRRRRTHLDTFTSAAGLHFQLGADTGLECSASKGIGRFNVLVLIASLAAILLWLIGTAAERGEWHERLRPGSRKRRAYSRLFLARLLLTLEEGRSILAELIEALGPLDQCVASDHDALLAQ
jgi:hypothetical protein